MKFLDVVNNQWVVGIFTPLIGSVIVIVWGKLIKPITENKRIQKKTESARNNITLFLERFVTNGTKLEKNNLSMVISSIARKHDIPASLISEKSVLEDLLVKVYAIDYIQLNQREKILTDLEELYVEILAIKNSSSTLHKSNKHVRYYSHPVSINRRKQSNTLELLLITYFYVLILLVLLLLVTPTGLIRKLGYSFYSDNFVIELIMLYLIVLVAIFLVWVLKFNKKKEERRKKKKSRFNN